MKSYTNLRTLYGVYTQNTTSGNLTQGDEYINDGYRLILGMRPWPFLEKSDTVSTVASQQFYQIPANLERVRTVTITVSSTIHTPTEITSEADWQVLNETSSTSDTPEYYFIRDKRVGFWPIPASSSNTITIYGKREVRDLSIADYTTGGVESLANGGTAVVGTGTTWTAAMIGRFLRITHSDTANKGDGFWYEIGTYTSATSIGLTKPYEGTAITAGNAAYTIGQMPLLPEAYHVLPVYYAAAEYWDSKDKGQTRASKYQNKYQTLLNQLIREYSSKTDNVVLDLETQKNNPNLYLRSVG